MNIIYYLKLYLTSFIVFLSIDFLWLSLIARNFYSKYLGFLMKEDINYVSALIFYLLFILGLVVFVISPSLETKNITNLVFLGILFGLVTYATYDLTNLATIKDWPLIVTIVDLVWGMFISVSVSLITYFIANKFLL